MLVKGMVSVVNFTPHEVVLVDAEGNAIYRFPSVGIARCTETSIPNGNICDIPLVKKEFGEVTGLPDFIGDGTVYIVSNLVAQALKGRPDLIVPADIVRNEEGQIIGCKAFSSYDLIQSASLHERLGEISLRRRPPGIG